MPFSLTPLNMPALLLLCAKGQKNKGQEVKRSRFRATRYHVVNGQAALYQFLSTFILRVCAFALPPVTVRWTTSSSCTLSGILLLLLRARWRIIRDGRDLSLISGRVVDGWLSWLVCRIRWAFLHTRPLWRRTAVIFAFATFCTRARPPNGAFTARTRAAAFMALLEPIDIFPGADVSYSALPPYLRRAGAALPLYSPTHASCARYSHALLFIAITSSSPYTHAHPALPHLLPFPSPTPCRHTHCTAPRAVWRVRWRAYSHSHTSSLLHLPCIPFLTLTGWDDRHGQTGKNICKTSVRRAKHGHLLAWWQQQTCCAALHCIMLSINKTERGISQHFTLYFETLKQKDIFIKGTGWDICMQWTWTSSLVVVRHGQDRQPKHGHAALQLAGTGLRHETGRKRTSPSPSPLYSGPHHASPPHCCPFPPSLLSSSALFHPSSSSLPPPPPPSLPTSISWAGDLPTLEDGGGRTMEEGGTRMDICGN